CVFGHLTRRLLSAAQRFANAASATPPRIPAPPASKRAVIGSPRSATAAAAVNAGVRICRTAAREAARCGRAVFQSEYPRPEAMAPEARARPAPGTVSREASGAARAEIAQS